MVTKYRHKKIYCIIRMDFINNLEKYRDSYISYFPTFDGLGPNLALRTIINDAKKAENIDLLNAIIASGGSIESLYLDFFEKNKLIDKKYSFPTKTFVSYIDTKLREESSGLREKLPIISKTIDENGGILEIDGIFSEFNKSEQYKPIRKFLGANYQTFTYDPNTKEILFRSKNDFYDGVDVLCKPTSFSNYYGCATGKADLYQFLPKLLDLEINRLKK